MHINKFCRYCRFYNRKNRICNQYRTGALHSTDEVKPACFRFNQNLAKHPVYSKALIFFTSNDIVTIVEWSVLTVLVCSALLGLLAPAPIATVALSIFVFIMLSYIVLFLCMLVWDYLICPVKDAIAQSDDVFKCLK